MPFATFIKQIFLRAIHLTAYFLILCGVLFFGFDSPKTVQPESKQSAIENALYLRTEFFGAEAIVPFPTEQARTHLAELLQRFPDDPEIHLKLSELDEKLGRFEDAENSIKAIKPENLQSLADFYGRRAAFEKQAEILELILEKTPVNERGAAFSNLISFAKKHDLKKYLARDFYQKTISQNGGENSILLDYVENLKEEKKYVEALQILDESIQKFPASKSFFLEKKIQILVQQNKILEAEKIYSESFEPFWSEDQSRKFYDFLEENDLYRQYEIELKQKFKQNPTDFQAAVRLIHFRRNEGDDFGDIVQKLENARAAQKIEWKHDEILIVSQFLIESGDGNSASRFLYTLCADPVVKEKGELKRKVLYQIFELLSDANDERLALTRGNLDFYETIAKSDADPGMTTGILSLIFSDSNPRAAFEAKQKTAVKLFNRAAAYRIFQEFKNEYADAPELAQMYLDIIRLYTAAQDTEIAGRTLNEFEVNTENFKDYADAALKLSDAYIATRQFEKERQIYQKLLDFLGKSDKRKFYESAFYENSDLTQIKPATLNYPPLSNEGIKLSSPKNSGFYYEKPNNYSNFLRTERGEIYYADVLSRYVASLARENKTQEILDLYSAETAKYSNEEPLYEQMLQWLGQTNLAEKQFEVYQKALLNFQGKSWRERFARWLIRNERREDFENFSRTMVSTFDDAQTQEYLRQFINGKEFSNAKSLDRELYFALYSLAHERFPHNIAFVKGLLSYYRQNKMDAEYRKLLAEYYFESPEIRADFLNDLAKTGELRGYLQNSVEPSTDNSLASLPYKLFRADAFAQLSDFENSIIYYRELDSLYPNTPEFSEHFLSIARSFGQTNRNLLLESATFARNQAERSPANANYRIRAGEIHAELGDYAQSRANWEKLIALDAGEKESYLNTATVFWDYFQFDDALKTISDLRRKNDDENLYAFQMGAILEAKKEKRAAISEYLKALDENEISADKWRAKERLKQLFRRNEYAGEINSRFETARKSAQNEFRLTFNFADALYQMKQQPEAVKLILRQIEREKSKENLIEAKQFFRALDETEAHQKSLARLIEISSNQRDAIAFRFQLADNFTENYEPEKAKQILTELVEKFPTNYGVLKETENFYWDLGEREKSVAVLQAARNRARGEYFYQFSRKLARRLTWLNRHDEAEKILAQLQNENPNDGEVFSELTDIYVRTDRASELRKTFDSVIEALKKQELEPRDLKNQSADLRRKMISAFTRLKDYDSAAEQYIEIINREPENEENVEEAISFVKRYGGAEKFLDYYRKVAAESFKNYRWNVVLARIYEAGGDLQNAAENYRTAIFNQPELPELYVSLGEIYLKMQNYQAALENVNKLLELTGEDTKFIKQKAQILEKLGRKTEAEAELAKLPAEELPKPQTLTEQFAEAQNLRRTENQKAVENYRAAFENLTQNPFQTVIKQSDITAFVQTVYAEDSLDRIASQLWILREKLTTEINNPESVNSGRARDNLRALDAAFVESVAQIVKTQANGNEINTFRKDIESRLDSIENYDAPTQIHLKNLISQCGFVDLQEKILLKSLENSASENRTANLRSLVDFYKNRQNYRRVLEILKNNLSVESLDLIRVYAETARILDEPENELIALRILFAKQATNDEFTDRFLEVLYEKHRLELENIARSPSPHQMQIINFLLAKNEPDLAVEAIKNSSFSESWKAARMAETYLKLNKFGAENESFFTNALKIDRIGKLIEQKSDEKNNLIGADRFNLSGSYGKWLFAANDREKAELYLAAMLENKPKDGNAQFALGYFYLKNKDFSRALEHFQLASELSSDEKHYLPYIGAAHFQAGEREKAFEIWGKIIQGENASIENASIYLKTLTDFEQAEKARRDLNSFLIKRLKTHENDSDAEENFIEFIQDLSKTFSDENAKTAYFLELCGNSTDNKILPELLINESLIDRKNFSEFYKILIARAEGFDDYEHDYDFVPVLEKSWDIDEAEALYDAENDFEIKDTENEKLGWQRKHLEFLLENRNYSASAQLVGEIENSLKGHHPRPVWLRLASFRVLLNQNKSQIAFGKMLKFTGIEISPNSQKAILPNMERLNLSLEILKIESRPELALDLQEAFYTRQLAVAQYNSANFTGLARAEFQKGKTAEAQEILKLMTEFSDENSQAKLDSLPMVVRFSDKEKLPFETQNSLKTDESLKLAAELSAEFGFENQAVLYREKLRAISPLDSTNNIELARLYANTQNPNEAVKILIEMISGKQTDRKSRWQSLICLAEIGGNDEGFRQKIVAENQTFEQQDKEIWVAINAFALFQSNRAPEAIDLLRENDFTFQLKFLRAVFEKKSGLTDQALQTYSELAEKNKEIGEIFGFSEFAPQFQMIDLYLSLTKNRAALELARNSGLLKMSESLAFFETNNSKFRTIEERTVQHKYDETRQMLEKLSTAAETITDFAQAIEYENAKSKLLTNDEENKISSARIESLQRRLAEKSAGLTAKFAVDEKTVSGF